MYRLDVAGYTGTAGDSFANPSNQAWKSKGMAFSTPDRDNDNYSGNCAAKSGWWYNWCASGALNEAQLDGIRWLTMENGQDIKKASMKVKPSS